MERLCQVQPHTVNTCTPSLIKNDPYFHMATDTMEDLVNM